MSNITNITKPAEEKIEINRAQVEHRATWMALIYDEMVKEGIDAEPIIRRAIKRCGNIHGKNFKGMCADPSNCQDFGKAFFGEVGVKTFEMNGIKYEQDFADSEFHYCALLNAWQKLGFDDKTCALLCDMAMDGDRGIAEAMGYTLDLTDTIAKGCASCKLHFHK